LVITLILNIYTLHSYSKNIAQRPIFEHSVSGVGNLSSHEILNIDNRQDYVLCWREIVFFKAIFH